MNIRIILACSLLFFAGCKSKKVAVDERVSVHDSAVVLHNVKDSTAYYKHVIDSMVKNVEVRWYRHDSIVYVVDTAGKVLSMEKYSNDDKVREVLVAHTVIDSSMADRLRELQDSVAKMRQNTSVAKQTVTVEKKSGVPIWLFFAFGICVYIIWRKS